MERHQTVKHGYAQLAGVDALLAGWTWGNTAPRKNLLSCVKDTSFTRADPKCIDPAEQLKAR